jgi:predicted nucleotidyltransferase
LSPRTINPGHPVDPITIEILAAVSAAAGSLGIDYMLVGATARDVLLTNVFGIPPTRATRDVDFAVAVKDWNQFNELRAMLLGSGRFKEGRQLQRLFYTGDEGQHEEMLDMVPFGEIAAGTGEVAWPPDMKVIMNVVGYDDVLIAAETVHFSNELTGKVVSLAGLAVLKLLAWSDRGRDDARDVIDLQHLMTNYTRAGNIDRVYEEESVIENADYDPDLAGIILLGFDIARLASRETLGMMKSILDMDFDRITMALVKSTPTVDDIQSKVEQKLRLLRNALN